MNFKNVIFSLLLFMICFSTATAQSYRSLNRQTKDDISRSEWRKAVKETKHLKDTFDIVLSPIDRIVTDVKQTIAARGAVPVSVNSWGRDIMLPVSVRNRVVNECSQYDVIFVNVDSGFDANHKAYKGTWILPPSNYSGDESKHWHGTHTMGIIWQMTGDVARQNGNFKYKDAQILGGSGGGSFGGAVNMVISETSLFREKAANGTGIIFSNSWGATMAPYPPMEEAVGKSLDAGMIWTAANGNTGMRTPSYPASGKGIISVPSLDPNLRRSSYSTIGDFSDAAAPGRNINSTMPGDKEGKASGTSMANPFIAGLCGLAYGKYGDVLQGRNMLTYIRYICTDIDPNGFDPETGWGIPYVVKMLDTDPCTILDCEGNDNPNPDPDPNPELTYITADFEGYTMRWNYKGKNGWNILHIPFIRIETIGDGNSNDVYDSLQEWLPTYFNNRGIVLPDEMSTQDASWWTGQFLEYVAKQNSIDLDAIELNAIDEQGRKYFANDFNKSSMSVNAQGDLVFGEATLIQIND